MIKKKQRERKKIKDNKINIHALKTKKNNCLIRQEYHNSSKPITVVPGFKKYVKKKNKTVKLYKTLKKYNEDRQHVSDIGVLH